MCTFRSLREPQCPPSPPHPLDMRKLAPQVLEIVLNSRPPRSRPDSPVPHNSPAASSPHLPLHATGSKKSSPRLARARRRTAQRDRKETTWCVSLNSRPGRAQVQQFTLRHGPSGQLSSGGLRFAAQRHRRPDVDLRPESAHRDPQFLTQESRSLDPILLHSLTHSSCTSGRTDGRPHAAGHHSLSLSHAM